MYNFKETYKTSRNMITSAVLGLGLSLSGVALFLPSVANADTVHMEANNCEFYVQKVKLSPGSYQSVSVTLYIHAEPGTMEGVIKEVGFRTLTHTTTGDVPWQNMKASSVDPFGSGGDYRINLLLEAGAYEAAYEGVFYVQMSDDSFYWLHPKHHLGENFVISKSMFTTPESGDDLVWDEMWSSESEALRSFNPELCQ